VSQVTIEGEDILVTVEDDSTFDVVIEDEVIHIDMAPVGDRGPQGEPGQDGITTVIHTGGVPTFYLHTQNVAAAVWHIVHNLGYYPSVNVIDNAGTLIQGAVQHIDVNTLEVSFYTVDNTGATVPLAFAGQASLT
jgi:hypothetical protein